MSPLRDEETKDSVFIRDMWQQYTKKSTFDEITTKDEIRRNAEKVHAYLKAMESGAEHPDAKTLREYAEGQI